MSVAEAGDGVKQQDCNLVLYNGNYLQRGPVNTDALWASGTYMGGAFPCTLTVQGVASNGGSLTIQDGTGKQVWTTRGLALPTINTLIAGQSLGQNIRLYSPNGQYYLIVQNDGNLVTCESYHAVLMHLKR